MTLFYLCAALLVALCLLWLLVGLFKNPGDSLDQEAVNITLARDRGETLAAALADGSIDQATYDYEREQLDYDLAADLTVTSKSVNKRGGHIVAAVLVALFVPIAAGTLYLELGNPAGITQDKMQRTTVAGNSNNQTNTNANAQAQSPGPFAALLPKLEERLAAAPDDIQGWRLLGRSYLSIRDYGQAQNAFEKALALDENDADTITQLAESIAMGRSGELAGEPMALLDRAITLNPMHEHTLWLRSIGKQQVGDHQEALLGFNLLMGLAKDNPDAIATVDQMRSRSIQALGANSVKQTTEDRANEASEPVSELTGPAIEVTVSLDSSATDGAAAEYAVFIYATATNGPPMPLAVTRLSVKDLPATVILDDSMAMIPNMKLSSFPEVTIGARVSASGNPIAQSGDWFTEATNINVSDTSKITLTIDSQTP
ncbi:MAG: cytochrome c-type biogenesis protein CcmH [Granulosicoccus sp.]|jgi:cytochrome c-type biogenesis protein CcmH